MFLVTVCSNGDVRLLEGTVPTEGRVEFCVNNVWASVCSDSWTNTEAGVTCRQAGFAFEGATTVSTFGQGTVGAAVYDVTCTGSEEIITDCSTTLTQSCAAPINAGVRCQLRELL